jgi:hypothetical protein
MEDANQAPTPLPDKTGLDKTDSDIIVDPILYQRIIGSLMYATLRTRPDVAFAVAILSRYNARQYA